MGTISSMTAVLTASIGGFTAGMREAGGHAEGFGERFKHVAEGVIEVAALMGIGLSAEGIVEYLKHTNEAIEATGRLAVTLGVTTQALGQLQYAATVVGVSQETLNGGLTKLLLNLDKATDASSKQAAALNSLGLSTQDFVGLSADQAFLKVAASIDHAKDRSAALHAAVDLFGKNAGAELIPLLNLSQEEFRKFADEADKSGFALNGIDSAQVELAGQEIRKFQNEIQGAANTLIVQLAPYIEAAAEKLNQLGESGGGMGKMVVNAFEWVVGAVAKATDFLELLEAGWSTMKAGALFAIAGIQWGLGEVIEGITKVMDYFGIAHDGITQFADDIKKSHEDMMNSAGKAWDDAQHHIDNFASGANSAKAKAFFDDFKKHSTDAAQKIVEDHKKIQGAFVGADDKEDKKGIKKLQDEVHKLYEETRTPLEKFQEKVEEINKLFAEGADGMDSDLYARAIKKAEDELDKATAKKEKHHKIDIDSPKLLEAGSAEASEFVAKFQAQARENEIQKSHYAEAQKQTTLQQRMVSKIEDAAFIGAMGWT